MLEASQIPVDTQLPQLPALVDDDAIAARFRVHALPGWTLRRCRAQDVRYYPGATCLLGYGLKYDDPRGERVPFALAGRAFGTEPVPMHFRDRPAILTPAGPIPSYWPDLRLAVWPFPEDPAMPGLGHIVRASGTLFDADVPLTPTPWTGTRPGLETIVVNYVPAKRCILRYDRLDHARPEPFYGKVYANDDASAVFARMQLLWEYAARSAPELGLARPLGCDRARNAVWQDSPGGEPLMEALLSTDMPALLRRVAATLAGLHRADLPAERVWRVADESVKLDRAREALLRFYPDLHREIDATIGPLAAAVPADVTRTACVHGDFHINQVLVRRDRVSIIDFDLFGRGDPLFDVARFLSRFETVAQGHWSAAEIAAAQRAFVSAYAILVPWPIDRRRLAWWKAVLLVNRQALKNVKKLAASGVEPVAAVLAAARAAAEGRDFA
jgi:hypothetical protein